MPAYPPGAPAGASMYDDSAEAAPAAAPEPPEAEGGATALLPKDFFGDKPLEPGSRCEVEIQRVHDDQVEVSYVPHEAEPEAPPMEQAPMPEGGGMDLAGLMG